jgi:hypothetical protein
MLDGAMAKPRHPACLRHAGSGRDRESRCDDGAEAATEVAEEAHLVSRGEQG